MGPVILSHIIEELNKEVRGGIISRIHQSDSKNLVFRIFVSGKTFRLLISVDPANPRMHLVNNRYVNPQNPLGFCAYLRSRIEGAVITGLTHLSGQRIATIDLEKRLDGTIKSYSLIVELTGKSANVILVDGDTVICDSLKRFPLSGSANITRPVEPGLKLAPLPLPATGFKANEEFTSPLPGLTWNETANKHFGNITDNYDKTTHGNNLVRAVDGHIKRLKRKLENLKGDYKKAEERLICEHLADVLKSHYAKLKRGAASIELEDYTTWPVKKITIALDPGQGPKENIERYYKLAKKAKTGMALLKTRIPESEAEIEYLEAVRYNISEADTQDDLISIEEELLAGGYIKTMEEPKLKKKDAQKTEPIRTLTSSEGFTILCGKSGEGNDLIVKKHALQGDIWFHASKCPGSHVLIKTAGRSDMTKKTLEEAAAIAAYHSKNKNASKVEVIYTDARNVKKPKGAKPGSVTVKEHKSIVVRPQEGVK